jgi:aspartate-semialdehyde dehydrogenase
MAEPVFLQVEQLSITRPYKGACSMSERINVGILGATGMVGQNYIRLLRNHPMFRVTHVAASPASAGKRYIDAVAGRWHMPENIPAEIQDLEVADAGAIDRAKAACSLVFSAVSLDKEQTARLESDYAAAGLCVVSNNSAHRNTPDVPMVIPEINPDHLEIIARQRKNHGWGSGLIVVKPNCSIQSYMTPIFALINGGFPIRRMIVSTLQALSGAGYPGPSALDMIDNVVPFIRGEEEKSEREPLKILGSVKQDHIEPASCPSISAHCNRVPVIHGHLACVSVEFEERKPTIEQVISLWEEFSALPQKLNLPLAPKQPLIYRHEPDRPQPAKDRDEQKAMAVVVGRLRKCAVFDYRFVGLHHNTVRGAAGGCILIAELLKERGYVH